MSRVVLCSMSLCVIAPTHRSWSTVKTWCRRWTGFWTRWRASVTYVRSVCVCMIVQLCYPCGVGMFNPACVMCVVFTESAQWRVERLQWEKHQWRGEHRHRRLWPGESPPQVSTSLTSEQENTHTHTTPLILTHTTRQDLIRISNTLKSWVQLHDVQM